MGAIRLRLGGFLEVTDDDFEWAMQLNFFTGLRATCAAIGPMVAQGRGVDRQRRFRQRLLPTGRSDDRLRRRESGRRQPHEITSQEFGAKGIRINAVSPGPVSTDLWLGEDGVAQTVGRSLGIDADTAASRSSPAWGGIPSGRFTTPEEVATLVVLLASERTANVTGANFVIDGGLIKTT